VPCATAHSTPRTTGPAVYRPRRPAATLLHRTVREHLETYLASQGQDDDLAANVPFHIQAVFRSYIECYICPSCATRRMIIVRILGHIGEHTETPEVWPARRPPN
jgi:hypothetical protein